MLIIEVLYRFPAVSINMNAQAALKSYGHVQVETGIQDASSHRLIEMLFEGLMSRLAQAKGALQQKNYEAKGERISSAISIVLGLKDSVDLESGGEVAANLYDLYDYVQRTLWRANTTNDESLIDECALLISEVSTAWKQIG